MKVCLIHPAHHNSTDDMLDPPLGLLYIASVLKKHDIDVSIVDLSGSKTINIPYADVYGITAYVSTLREVKYIATVCKYVNPDCKVVIGGAHATARPDDFPYADRVIQGYGENKFIKYITNEDTSYSLTDLLPAYDLVDIGSYHRKIDDLKSLPIITTRGCPYHCTACGLSSMHNKQGIMTATSSQVYKQLEQIHGLGIKALNIQDDIFTLNRKRLHIILSMIKEFGFRFRCMGRAGYDTRETYKMLADSGCTQIAWGIESGSQYILDRMNKQVSVQDNYNVIQWAKEYGITSRAFFIIGFPGETRTTLDETKQFIIDADPDQCFVSTMVPYPGTDVEMNPGKYGIKRIYHNYSEYYQVGKNGMGGLINFDTEWLTRYEFRELEHEFREFIHNRKMRGALQDYEKEMLK